ncbi:MAG TPA: hypothetical protein GX534_05690 [Thermoanaerobacterales bacterium]|nr:hypothetical protein [Thermoanaerobacterales bacterium]
MAKVPNTSILDLDINGLCSIGNIRPDWICISLFGAKELVESQRKVPSQRCQAPPEFCRKRMNTTTSKLKAKNTDTSQVEILVRCLFILIFF